MDVYFVRHGETTYNRRHIHQSPHVPLSETGRKQAVRSAEALQTLHPTLLITSEYVRTQETAGIMGNILHLSPTVNPLFHEVRRPTELYDTTHFSVKTMRYIFGSIWNRNQPAWRISDAENFADVHKRIESAFTYLESLEGTHATVVVVSHTMFINFMTAYMTGKRTLTLLKLIPYIIKIKSMKNGEITHIKRIASGNERVWVRDV